MALASSPAVTPGQRKRTWMGPLGIESAPAGGIFDDSDPRDARLAALRAKDARRAAVDELRAQLGDIRAVLQPTRPGEAEQPGNSAGAEPAPESRPTAAAEGEAEPAAA